MPALTPPGPGTVGWWVESLKYMWFYVNGRQGSRWQVGRGGGRPWGSSLVAVAHTIAPGAAFQLLVLGLLLPLAGCTLGDRDAGHLGALGWMVGLSKPMPGGNAPSPTPSGPCATTVASTYLLYL